MRHYSQVLKILVNGDGLCWSVYQTFIKHPAEMSDSRDSWGSTMQHFNGNCLAFIIYNQGYWCWESISVTSNHWGFAEIKMCWHANFEHFQSHRETWSFVSLEELISVITAVNIYVISSKCQFICNKKTRLQLAPAIFGFMVMS